MNMPIGLGRAFHPVAPQMEPFSTPASRHYVLLVDDETAVLEELADALGRRGLHVLVAGSAEAALAVLRGRADIATLVTDIRMPGQDGLALAEAALRGRREDQALEVVLITGYAAAAHGMAATRLGAFGILQKPMRGAELARMVQQAQARAVARRAASTVSRDPAWARPWTAEPPLNPTQAAEALLRNLAQRLDAAGNGIEAIAQDLRGPLGDLLRAAPRLEAATGEPRRLLGLLEDLMDIAALEGQAARPQLAPISAHGLLGAVAARLSALGLRCGRRIILQPDADPAFLIDTPRMVRAMALLAGLALPGRLATGMADLSIDAGAGLARMDLMIRPDAPDADPDSAGEARMPIAIARRLVTLQGGRLDAWMLPEGSLRARLLIRSS